MELQSGSGQRNPRRRMKLYVRTDRLADIVEAWAERWNGAPTEDTTRRPRSSSDRLSATDYIAHHAQVKPSTVLRVRDRESAYTELGIADAILCAIDRVEALQIDLDVYERVVITLGGRRRRLLYVVHVEEPCAA